MQIPLHSARASRLPFLGPALIPHKPHSNISNFCSPSHSYATLSLCSAAVPLNLHACYSVALAFHSSFYTSRVLYLENMALVFLASSEGLLCLIYQNSGHLSQPRCLCTWREMPFQIGLFKLDVTHSFHNMLQSTIEWLKGRIVCPNIEHSSAKSRSIVGSMPGIRQKVSIRRSAPNRSRLRFLRLPSRLIPLPTKKCNKSR